ncbi:MAG: response regulator transcription factor [Magnetococcales bacterium]|nr:response regulator transcription factor [Magnetococcales bacterium]
MIRIFIADDHAIVRAGLSHMLAETGDMRVDGEASDGQQAIQRILKESWDVVLLDVSMPGKDGLEVLRRVRQGKPDLPILILTMHDEELMALRFLKAGASGYITKDSAPDQLVQAIRKVVSGGRHISSDLAERMLMEWNSDVDKALHERLSDREFTVLRHLASGKTVGIIAEELGLSPRTISTYRTRLLEKMGMKNNSELTHYAMKFGLVD